MAFGPAYIIRGYQRKKKYDLGDGLRAHIHYTWISTQKEVWPWDSLRAHMISSYGLYSIRQDFGKERKDFNPCGNEWPWSLFIKIGEGVNLWPCAACSHCTIRIGQWKFKTVTQVKFKINSMICNGDATRLIVETIMAYIFTERLMMWTVNTKEYGTRFLLPI